MHRQGFAGSTCGVIECSYSLGENRTFANGATSQELSTGNRRTRLTKTTTVQVQLQGYRGERVRGLRSHNLKTDPCKKSSDTSCIGSGIAAHEVSWRASSDGCAATDAKVS